MKYHPHRSVLFVTFSIQEGLLLLCNPLIEALIKSCLARAASLYPVLISHLILEATHGHLLLTVDNPDDVPQFMRHFKAEVAHRLNNLLGRELRTIWCEGYDSPIVLSLPRAIAAIAYLYANPAKDNLVDSIDLYPGFSTWRMFLKDDNIKSWPYLRRAQFKQLSPDSHNLPGYTRAAKKLLSDSASFNSFTLHPNAWLDAFGITDKLEQQRINNILISRVRKLELRARNKRLKSKKPLFGAERLTKQAIDLSYRPKRTGKKMWCLSERRRIRQPFIRFLKQLFTQAREIRQRWFLGDYSIPYPLGLYPPAMPKLAEPLFSGG